MINIKTDSRKITPGDTFVALKGIGSNGDDYIEKAIENGASKIVCEKGTYFVTTENVEDTREYLVNYLKEEATQMELCSFIREGLQDIYYNRLLDSDTVFNQLEERYHTNE